MIKFLNVIIRVYFLFINVRQNISSSKISKYMHPLIYSPDYYNKNEKGYLILMLRNQSAKNLQNQKFYPKLLIFLMKIIKLINKSKKNKSKKS